MRVERHWSQPLWRITIDIWVRSTTVTEWWTATLLPTWKLTKKLFFHLLDHTILNSHFLLKYCGSKLSQIDFRLTLVRNVVELAGPQPCPLQTACGLSALATRIVHLEECSCLHWPTTTETRMDCVVCHAHTKKRRQIQTKCEKCNVGLCISGCFKDYHTKAQV
jgi:hypothetical protein